MAQLEWNFAGLHDKESAANHLLALTKDEDWDVRRGAANALGSAFPYVTDKEPATNDLLALTKDEDSSVRRGAADSLVTAFQHVTDKELAANDLLALTKDKDSYVRRRVASSLGSAFPHVTDKEQAWKTLLSLTKDEDSDVRWRAANALGSAFQHVTDKEQAANDLLALTKDEDRYVRRGAADSLVTAFQHVTDKEQAANDLLALTKDEDSDVRRSAANALGSAFQHVTDKEQATKDLLVLTKDEDNDVRRGAASALGSAFGHVTGKEQAANDLLALTKDEDSDVRSQAYHSLGKISIFKATEVKEEDFKKELEKALEYFEKSANEATWFNPARFCLPFYRSFHAITFKKYTSEHEVKKSIKEAKKAVWGSESKEKLLEAIENLSNALTEAQKAGKIGLEAKQSDLKAWKSYCDKTEAILKTTQDNAPVATRMLEKCMPIVGQRIDEIIDEIREKAKSLLEATENTGTPYESPSAKIERCSQQLSDTDIEKSKNLIPHITKNLNELCKQLPDDKKGVACDLIKELDEESEYKDMLFSIRQILFYLVPNIKAEVETDKKPEPINRKFLKALKLLLAISLGMLTFSYTLLDYMGHPTARMYSLIIFGITFILVLIIYLIKR